MGEQEGSLEVICGCMYSGKTEELIRRVKRESIAQRKVQIFKSHQDTRYSIETIQTHYGLSIKAQVVPDSASAELNRMIEPDTEVVAIDEVQFFDETIVQVCDRLADSGVRVIVAGLDLNFRGEPFGPVPSLLAKADKVDKLTAVCVECKKNNAVRSQRLVDGKPARWDEEIVVVGAYETYEAVCRQHHRIDKPEQES